MGQKTIETIQRREEVREEEMVEIIRDDKDDAIKRLKERKEEGKSMGRIVVGIKKYSTVWIKRVPQELEKINGETNTKTKSGTDTPLLRCIKFVPVK